MPTDQSYLSPELAHRLAAIDVGSNSIRLVVAEVVRGGQYRILDEERESTRLGRSLATTGDLDDASVDASLACLRRFKQIAEGFQVQQIRTIATCAVREAKNGPDFCRHVRDEIGLEIEVISALEEARAVRGSPDPAHGLTEGLLRCARVSRPRTWTDRRSPALCAGLPTPHMD